MHHACSKRISKEIKAYFVKSNVVFMSNAYGKELILERRTPHLERTRARMTKRISPNPERLAILILRAQVPLNCP
jgi:hypothetical protein